MTNPVLESSNNDDFDCSSVHSSNIATGRIAGTDVIPADANRPYGSGLVMVVPKCAAVDRSGDVGAAAIARRHCSTAASCDAVSA